MRASIVLATLLLLASCGKQDSSTALAKAPVGNNVQASCEPLRYFAQRIAGEHLTVNCPMPADTDPHTWRPDRAAIMTLQSADLILINGAGFESWLTTVSLPEDRVINTGKRLEQDLITYETPSTHRHGSDGEEHTHTGIDSHTWVDPNNAKIQAATIRQALEKKWPAHAAGFEKNLQSLVADLDQLDKALSKIKPARPLLAAHPSYNYLSKRYAWNITNITLDPETIPQKGIVPDSARNGIILWESAPRDKVSALLKKQYGIQSLVFRTTGNLESLKANAAALKAALE